MFKKLLSAMIVAGLIFSLSACSLGLTDAASGIVNTTVTANGSFESVENESNIASSGGNNSSTVNSSKSALDTTAMFTDRDLEQEADLSEAQILRLESGSDITIETAGVYVVEGSVTDATIVINATDNDKVQLVLNGVNINNSDFPCIYVKNADKIFVTTVKDTENTLSVTGAFVPDGTTNTDAVIFSRDDLIVNGLGSLMISSSANGISGKDDIKITGGTISITCTEDAVEANDSIRVSDGNITITTKKDGFHAEDDDDNTTGYIYIGGGVINITSEDDGLHATTILQIDKGTLAITAHEGLEATWIQINDGSISITASDDGINAAKKSTICTPLFEMNNGTLSVDMGQGDTDAIDSNGNIEVNGGEIIIKAQFAFDYDKTASHNGGTITVNDNQIDGITSSMMGGGPGKKGGFGGKNNGGIGGK